MAQAHVVRGDAATATSATDRTVDDAMLQDMILREYEDAREYMDTEIDAQRTKATEYYLGKPFGNEEAGRSSVVSRDVRTTVLSFLPSIMRVLFGTENVTEFVATTPQNAAFAEQATNFINEVTMRLDNNGYAEFYAAIKDALVRKAGFFKWWWEEKTDYRTATYSGLSHEQVMLLEKDESVESVDVEPEADEDDKRPAEQQTFRAVVKYQPHKHGYAAFKAVDPTELLINREAVDFDETCRYAAHRRLITVDDGVAMGYDFEDLIEHAGSWGELDMIGTKLARLPEGVTFGVTGQGAAGNRPLLYVEHYVRADVDGDTFAELVKVCTVGSEAHILHKEGVDDFPFAKLVPDPEPHTFFGLCPADDAMDIQLSKSAILRNAHDALSLSLHPRTEAVEGMVNFQDLMNSEVGGVVRVKAPGQLRDITTADVAPSALNMLQYLNGDLASRTKQSEASTGLDAENLQSTTKEGVQATMSAAQAQLELVTRTLGETGVRRLFRGLLKTIIQHQDQIRTVQLDGVWTPVDPRQWDTEMDVRIKIALGGGGTFEKIQTMLSIKGAQELIISTMGPSNELVKPYQYYNTLAKLTKLSGEVDVDKYFTAIPKDYQVPTPPTPTDQAAVLAKVQMQELQLKAQIEAEKIKLERLKIELEDQREREKMALDFQAEMAKANGIAKQTTDVATAQMAADHKAAQLEAETRVIEATLGMASEHHAASQDAQATMHGNMANAAAQMHGNTTAADAQTESAQIAADAQPEPTATA